MKYIFWLFFSFAISPTFAQFDENSDTPPPDSTAVPLDSNVQYVLPVVLEEPPSPDNEGGNVISIGGDNEDFGVVAGEALSEEEVIRDLNAPLNLHEYSPAVQEVMKVCQTEAAKILGENNARVHLRVYRDRLNTLESMHKKLGDKFDDGYMGALLYFTIVYQNHVFESLTFAVQDGKMMEEHWEKTKNTLTAYRQLLDGQLKVGPNTAMSIVFGNQKPYDWSIHLRYEQEGDLKIPQGSKYQRPKIWWYIWENACTICKEGEIDANNPENYLLETVDRRKRRW